MYRFNDLHEKDFNSSSRFKYNKCIGSMLASLVCLAKSLSFKYNKCIGSIELPILPVMARATFKYNKCIGSMKIEWEFADLSIFSTPHFIAVSCFFSS